MWISTVRFLLLAVTLFPKLEKTKGNTQTMMMQVSQPNNCHVKCLTSKGSLKKRESDRGLTAFPFEVRSVILLQMLCF